MHRYHARFRLALTQRLPLLLSASTIALLGPGTTHLGSPSPAHARSAKAAKTITDSAQPKGVRVRVAGKAQCRGCSIRDLETLLGARARKPLPKDSLQLPPELQTKNDARAMAQQYRWSVKFRDDLQVRLTPKGTWAPELLPAQAHQTPNPGLPQLYSRGSQDLDAVEALRARYQARFVREIDLPDNALDNLRERALRRSLVAQPDLAALYWIDATFATPQQMLRFGQELQALPEVEFVHLQPLGVRPPQDIPPTTSDHSRSQGYLGPDPGVNGTYGWQQGYFGEGVRISDCEYSWEVKHEDLAENPIQVEKGQSANGHDIDHGTAVMGIVVAGHNGFGVKGLAPKAKPAVYPEGPNRRTASVTNAIADSKAGDIVMLEMQTYGQSQKHLVPAEYDKPVWMATKTGTDAGVIVIGAAGNGYENLDIPFYKKYRDRGDSGAIIVGAGTSNRTHSKMDFSTYGKRVDVHAWGQNVVTTGYGDLKKYGGDKRQVYTRKFAGTSSATPIVSGAAALVQEFSRKEHNHTLTPLEMRKLLRETGIPQKGGGQIGPIPNVKAAMEKLGKSEPDKEDPEVEITDPAKDIEATLEEDQSAHGFKVEVKATDNKGIKSVQLEIDGKKVGDPDKEEPYIFDVELEAGEYEIVAVATDLSDNEGRSETLDAEILPFEETDESEDEGESESDGGSESENKSDNESDTATENSEKEDSPAETEDSDSESAKSDKTPSEEESEGKTPENSNEPTEDKPEPPKAGGCALRDSTPSPLSLGFGLVALAAWTRRKLVKN